MSLDNEIALVSQLVTTTHTEPGPIPDRVQFAAIVGGVEIVTAGQCLLNATKELRRLIGIHGVVPRVLQTIG